MQSLKVLINETAPDFSDAIQLITAPDFDDVWVLAHSRPDEDCVGSAHALAYTLHTMGKRVAVYCRDPFETKFKTILSPLCLPSTDSFIPRHCIAVDSASPTMFGDAFPYLDRIDLVIDHHLKNQVICDKKVVCPEAAACGELILSLVLALDQPMDEKLALCLYTAIAGDTGCFMFSNTTEKTHLAAAYLYGFTSPETIAELNRIYFDEKSNVRLAIEGYVLSHTRFFANGKIGFIALSSQEKAALSPHESDYDQLANLAKKSSGTELGIVLHTQTDGRHKLSARSNRYFDCADFCAHFGGGGHIRAAGGMISGEFDTVIDSIISEAIKRMENCQNDGTFESK